MALLRLGKSMNDQLRSDFISICTLIVLMNWEKDGGERGEQSIYFDDDKKWIRRWIILEFIDIHCRRICIRYIIQEMCEREKHTNCIFRRIDLRRLVMM